MLRTELIQLARQLIAIPSVSEDITGRMAVITWIEQFCAALPNVFITRHESHGFPSLVVGFDPQPAKSLILNAHVDVVPAQPEQFVPFVADQRLYGRGAQDMKGAAAVMLLLLKEFAESNRRPSIMWQFVTDEEIGGAYGTRHLLEQGYTADFFLVGEPTDLKIVTRAKGTLRLAITQPAGCLDRSQRAGAANPIVLMVKGIAQLMQRYPPPTSAVWRTTVTPTWFHSHPAAISTQAEARLVLDVRWIPEDTPDEITRCVQSCFPEARVSTIFVEAPLNTRRTNTHVTCLARAVAAVTEQPAVCYDEHFGSDANYYSTGGTPAVCFGPAGAGLHSHDEWVSLDSLETYYHVLRQFVQGYC